MERIPQIAIVDDDGEFRASLQVLLEQAGYGVVPFDSAERFLPNCEELDVDCVILDEQLSGMVGLDAYREMRGRGMQTPVVVLTGYATVPLTVKAYEQGIAYLLEKPASPDDLLARVSKCVEKSATLRAQQAVRAERLRQLALLSDRERQVVALLAEGTLNKQIASALGVSLRTVESHRRNVCEKLGAQSIADLVAFAIEAGLRKSGTG